MRFNSALISNFLLVSAVLADRGGENNSQLAKRDDDDSYYFVTENWAGCVLDGTSEKLDVFFYLVGGTVTVPKVLPASDSDAEVYGVSVWLGIGGGGFNSSVMGRDPTAPCELNNIIQAGISLNVTKEGTITCTPWFAWYPNTISYIPIDFPVSPGDQLRISAGVTSDLNATFFIDNFTEKKISNFTMKAPYKPCTSYAEWVVEDYMVNNVLIPLANYSQIIFTNAEAFYGDRNKYDYYGPEKATLAARLKKGPTNGVTGREKDTMTVERQDS